jgi:hypothetical protein
VVHADSASLLCWYKSTRSGTSGCVEVATINQEVLLRDSKDPQGHWLRLTALQWSCFLEAAKGGEFDRHTGQHPPPR